MTLAVSKDELSVDISTHTLTWSVTAGGTTMPTTDEFQLTRSRGAGLVRQNQEMELTNFNSHAHVERDSYT